MTPAGERAEAAELAAELAAEAIEDFLTKLRRTDPEILVWIRSLLAQAQAPRGVTPADERTPKTAEWTWLYDSHEGRTAFIAADPTGDQEAIAEGLHPDHAEQIVTAHNATIREIVGP